MMIDMEVLFAEVETTIREGQAKLDERADFDLSGLQHQVESLCNYVTSQPQEIQQSLVPRLSNILQDLTMLGQGLKAEIGEPQKLQNRKAAHVAYKIADSRDNFGKRDDDGER